jgi:tetratricopeptide (TPR) repeat protein
MLVSAFVALTLGLFANPDNAVITTLAFGAWAILLTPLVIDLLHRVFGPAVRDADPDRGIKEAEYSDCVRSGVESMREGRLSEALDWFDSAASLFPNRIEPALAGAEALRRDGRFREALRRLDEAATLHAGDPALHLALARYACLAEDFRRAKEEVQLAASIDPACWEFAADEPDLFPIRGWVARRGV